MKIVQVKYILNYFSWKVVSSLSSLWMNMNAIFRGILSWQYVTVVITNIVNTITGIHCYPMLYKLCRNKSVVIFLGALRGNHYLDQISQRSTEVCNINYSSVVKRKKERGSKRERGEEKLINCQLHGPFLEDLAFRCQPFCITVSQT